MSEPAIPPEFSVVVERQDDGDVVRVVGELDLSTVTELTEATRPLVERSRTVLFDLSGLSFVDSSGLRFFVGLHHAARRDGFAFTMTRPRHRVFRAFEVTTLDTILPWADGPA